MKRWIQLFQGEEDISYIEGLLAVHLPVVGSGELFESVTEEWKNSDKTAPNIVS